MTEYRIWPATDGPLGSFNDAKSVSQGMEFRVSTEGWVKKIWYWRASASMGVQPVLGQIFLSTGVASGTPIDNPKEFGPAGPVGTWQSVTLNVPVPVIPAHVYRAVVYRADGEYAATSGNHYWDTGPGANGITNGILTAVSAPNSNGGQSTYTYGAGIQYPTTSFNSGNYWIDLSVSDTSDNTQAFFSLL